jgi:hypothetical protein
VAIVVAAAVALVALNATDASHAAGLRTSSGSGANSATTPTDNSAGSLDQWAACERAHGDSNQANPTVEHGEIYIAVPIAATPAGNPSAVTGTCSEYLAAAQRAVAGGPPIGGWGDEAKYVAYANCMRANGFPTFPYPSGVEPDGHSRTNFNGTGIDPESPAFINGSANQTCGKQVGAPAWWINSWGPPGAVVVYPAGTNPNSPLPPGPPTQNGKPIAVPGTAGGPGCNVPSIAGRRLPARRLIPRPA